MRDNGVDIQAVETENIGGEAFNIAGKKKISIRELAKLMARLFGENTEITYTGESWEGDIVKLIPDTSKIQRKLNFTPTIKLRKGLQKLKTWFDRETPTHLT